MSSTNTNSKQKLIARFGPTLKKELGVQETEARPVLEQIIYAILREGSSRAKADHGFQQLRERFFDWNEIRVSTARDVARALTGLTHTFDRASRIISLLQQVFETSYNYDLESMLKKGLKLAEKQLERFDCSTNYTVAFVVQNALGGHAMPVDEDMHRTLVRTHLVSENDSTSTAQGILEHLVPKAKGSCFSEMLSAIAHDYCWASNPKCQSCPLLELCPTGQENIKRKSTTKTKAKARP